VDEAVVMAAKEDEVVERGLATMGPVANVVGIDEAAHLAPGEATAPIPLAERPIDRRRNRPRLPPDGENLAASPDDRRQRPVTAQPADDLRADRGPIGELRAPGPVTGEGLGVDVHDHVVAIAALDRGWAASEVGLGDPDERVGVRWR
jgi:hypothetical protein